jgi:hypothetical protein
VNTQLNNFIESIGYDLLQGDKERSLNRKYEGTNTDEILETVIQIQDDPDLVPEDVIAVIDEGSSLLDTSFNFYGFDIKVHKNQQIDIVNRQFLRYYKKRVNDLATEKEQLLVEMDSMRQLMKGFQQDQSRSERKIKEL